MKLKVLATTLVVALICALPSAAQDSAANVYTIEILVFRATQALGGAEKAADSIRLFMVPGMAHCGGGDGTSVFDSLAVLEQWVEQKKTPAQIAASHITNGVSDRTRPLCPYPSIAAYKGAGDTNDAANFICSKP